MSHEIVGPINAWHALFSFLRRDSVKLLFACDPCSSALFISGSEGRGKERRGDNAPNGSNGGGAQKGVVVQKAVVVDKSTVVARRQR